MSTTEQNYQPEPYWSKVAERINTRKDGRVVAGDDEPFYRYKRDEFLKMLDKVDVSGKNILEVGSGPGGNVQHLIAKQPIAITGADISRQMIDLSKDRVKSDKVQFVKIDGQNLPFKNNEFNISFTATVLQHNTDEVMLKNIIKEICRVTKDEVVIFERIESSVKGDELNLGRPVTYYQNIFETFGFKLVQTSFINIRSSYLVCGAIRKLLNKSSRQEGEPLTKFSIFLQNITLPATKILDKIFKSKSDLGMLTFVKAQ